MESWRNFSAIPTGATTSFYEYFHADKGSEIGASHQTGWTGIIATVLTLSASLKHKVVLKEGVDVAIEDMAEVSEES